MKNQQANEVLQKYIEINDNEPLEFTEINGASPGVTMAVIGGIHGDEEEGVLSVRRLIQFLKETPIKGSVRALAVANPAAYNIRNRLNPHDNKNLAREFPGCVDGSITQRIAHAITSEIINGADAMIDLHSAGVTYSMPLFCGFFETGSPYSRQCAKIANAFGAPIIWQHTKVSKGRSLSAAINLDVPAIYLECGGGGEVRSVDTDSYLNGLKNIMIELAMLEGETILPDMRRIITDAGGNTDQAITSSVSGVVVTHVTVGDIVQKGDLLCDVYDDQGQVNATIEAPINGIVMLLRRTARIEKNDVVAMLAPHGETLSY